MSESKKVLYKREVCEGAIKGLCERALDINNDKADYKYYNHIKDIILFGSLVNTDKDKVHDVDIAVFFENDREKMQKFHKEHLGILSDFISDMFSETILQERYLKGGKKVFSIHSNVHEREELRSIATSDRHIYLMKDYQLEENPFL